MALKASNVRVAVTGAVSVGNHGATAPTGTSDDISSTHEDLGYCDESGVVLTFPGEGETNSLTAWQDGATVRTLRSPSEDVPTLSVNFMETKVEVVEFVLGVEIDQTSTEGSFEYRVRSRSPKSVILDVVDGSELFRVYVPSGVVTDITDIEFVSDDAIKFGCTIGCDLDAIKDYNFKSWSTAFKSTS